MYLATVGILQPVREAVSYRGLFTVGWFGVREKYCSRLEIYDRLRGSEQADCACAIYGCLLNSSELTLRGTIHTC